MTAYKKNGYSKDYINYLCDTHSNNVHWFSLKRQQGIRLVADALRRNKTSYYRRICINNATFIDRGSYTLDLKVGVMRFECGFIAFSSIHSVLMF